MPTLDLDRLPGLGIRQQNCEVFEQSGFDCGRERFAVGTEIPPVRPLELVDGLQHHMGRDDAVSRSERSRNIILVNEIEGPTFVQRLQQRCNRVEVPSVDRTVASRGLHRETETFTTHTAINQIGVEHLVSSRWPQPRQLLKHHRRHIAWSDPRFALLVHTAEPSELIPELLLVPNDRLERLVHVVVRAGGSANRAADEQAHQVSVPGAESEPSSHLHQCVSLARSTRVVGDGQALDCEAATQLCSADKDLPHSSFLEVEGILFVVLLGSPVDHDDGAGSLGNLVVGGADELLQLTERAGISQLATTRSTHHSKVLGPELFQPRETLSLAVPRRLPQGLEIIGHSVVLGLLHRFVHQHRVVPIRLGALRFPEKLDRPGQDKRVESPQLFGRTILVALGPEIPYVRFLVRIDRSLVVVLDVVEIVEVRTTHVRARPLETDDEVRRKDVDAVLRIDKHIGKRCCGVTDVLRTLE